MSKAARTTRKQMEKNDPLVQKIAEEANLDYEYVEMMNYIEGDTEFKDIDTNIKIDERGFTTHVCNNLRFRKPADCKS